MKKVLFSLICLISFIGMVNAETQIAYDWGMYTAPDLVLGSGVLDNNVGIIARYYDTGSLRYNSFTKDGEEIYNESFDFDGDAFVVNNQIILFNYVDNVCHQLVFNKDMELTNDVVVSNCYYYNNSIVGETEKYYYINEFIFDKKTNEEVDVVKKIENHELYSEYLSYLNSNNEKAVSSTLFKMLTEEFDGTYLAVMSFFISVYADNYDFVDYSLSSDGSFALILFRNDNYTYEIDYYDSNFNLINKLESNSFNTPKVMSRNGNFYLFEMVELDVESPDGYDSDFDVLMSEYNSLGIKINEFNLVNINETNKYYGEYYNAREMFDVIETNDGFYLVMHKTVAPSVMDPVIRDDQSISYYWPTVQKFIMTYTVETKDNDSGSIIVDKETSVTGELIKYKVSPKEGYKLDKIIVTDDSGNRIEVKDSSFVMPSSNVTIEAVFVVDNPNTGVFFKVGFACIILLICYIFIILKNMKVKQYE